MTLGEFKTHIESFPNGMILDYGLSDPFCWRGDYSEVAFAIDHDFSAREAVLEKITAALNHSCLSYDGREYSFHTRTEVHFEENKNAYTDGRYTSQWIAELEKGIPYQTQEHRLINLLFPNK